MKHTGAVSFQKTIRSFYNCFNYIIHRQYDFPYESPIYTFTVAVLLGFYWVKVKNMTTLLTQRGALFVSDVNCFPLVSAIFCLFLFKETKEKCIEIIIASAKIKVLNNWLFT